MQPTAQQLAAEIEMGPFADELAPFWCIVFGPHQTKREELRHREGRLTPDAAQAINRILSDQSRRPLFVPEVSRNELVLAVAMAMLSLHRADLPAERKQDWRMTFELLKSGNIDVSSQSPELRSILDDMVTDGLIPSTTRDKLIAGTMSKQSRFSELGWTGVTDRMISMSKLTGLVTSSDSTGGA